ncbi:MAG: NTP transferase domain-containing protein [Polyangia bacterium]
MSALPLCGILVGGQARRLGGRPKGLLAAPDSGEPIVARLYRITSALGLQVVLVGEAPDYAAALPGLRWLRDLEPGPGGGPLGGLHALLAAAPGDVVALACDLPYAPRELIERLLPPLPPGIDARVPRRVSAGAAEGREPPWEPLCARYAASVLPVLRGCLGEGVRSLQALLRRLRVEPLQLLPAEHHALDDWDEPGDLPAGVALGASPSTGPVPVQRTDGPDVGESGAGQGRAPRR